MGESQPASPGVTEPDPATAAMHASVPILGAMGIRVLEADAGSARVLLPLAPNRNHVGSIYAGSLLSAAEVLGGLIGLAQGHDGFVPIVSQIEIDYLRPATTDAVAATTFTTEQQKQVREDAAREGRARFVLEVSVSDAAGTEVARAVGHYQLRRVATL